MNIMKNNLIVELFDKSKTYRMGILCTYGMNIEFLENYLLNLDGLANCINLCIFTDRNVYNSQFETNSIFKSKWINKRYLLTPIDTNGVFHPKMYILASDKVIRIGIGSANLTREGLATNLEIASVFEINQKDKTYMGLLVECLRFLEKLAIDSKSTSALNSVKEFISYISNLLGEQTEENVHLLHNLEQSIGMQVIELLKERTVREIQVISPFYDKKLKVNKWLRDYFPDASVKIYMQQGKTNFPISEYMNLSQDTRLYVFKNQERYLHGKAIIFNTDTGYFMLSGSANFTDSALLSFNYGANVEISMWGNIDKEIVYNLLRPNGNKAIPLNKIKDLEIAPIESNKPSTDSKIILDWLAEVSFSENEVEVILNDKEEYVPKNIFFNGKRDCIYPYAKQISFTGLNKSDIIFAQISGVDSAGMEVESGKMWIVNLDNDRESYSRKRYSVSEPSQLTEVLRDLIQNGTEKELIDYLLKFNIPLDLVGLNFRNSELRAMDSLGNVFGELMVQKPGMINHLGMYDAVKYFLATNYNKLCQHYDNIQLLKLNNFILIFSSVFSFMNTIHEQMVSTHKKMPIESEIWSEMRNYYDLFLNYSLDCLELLWLTDENHYSFEKLVNIQIENDSQKMLGDIKSFREFVFKMGYDYYLVDCYNTVKNICKWSNTYIKKGTVRTIKGTIVPMPISNNGMKDTYIIKRKKIYEYAIFLEKELSSRKFD